MTYEDCKNSIIIKPHYKCPMCEQEHKNSPVYELVNPTKHYKYFTICPNTKLPFCVEVDEFDL